MRVWFCGLALLLALFVAGCVKSSNQAAQSSTNEQPSAAPVAAQDPVPATAPSSGNTGLLTVIDGAGKPVLVVTGTGEKLDVKAGATLLGSLKLKEGKVSIYDAKGTQAGAVKLKDGDFSLRDASDAKLGKLAPKEGGYRLKDAQSKMLLKIKPKDGGFKVSDGDGETVLAKGKRKGGKLVLESEAGKTLFTVTGEVQHDAAGVLMAKSLTPMQQAALIIAVTKLK